jgi:hypothetical protein
VNHPTPSDVRRGGASSSRPCTSHSPPPSRASPGPKGII